MSDDQQKNHLTPFDDVFASDLLRSILHSPSLIKREWIRERNWVAVPVEQLGYVSRRELERLHVAILGQGIPECLVIYPTVHDTKPNCAIFPTTLEAVDEAVSVQAFCYLITARNLEFLYHKTMDDFTLIAGPRQFVQSTLGASIEAGQLDWREFASHPGWSKSQKADYEYIGSWYDGE